MQYLPRYPLLFILFLYRLFSGLLMGIYSNILSRDHVLVVILAWCSSRFVWTWKILGYLGIPSVGFIGPSLRLEGISAAVIKGMMLVAILLKTCFSRLMLGLYQVYTRFSRPREGLLRGRKAPAVSRGRNVPCRLPGGGCHGLPIIYGGKGKFFGRKGKNFYSLAKFFYRDFPRRLFPWNRVRCLG